MFADSECCDMNRGVRGQSELTAVLLVVAVGVVLAGGVFVSLDLDPTTPAPQASVSVDANGDQLRVTHTDGDVFGTDEAVVLVRVGDREERYRLSSFTGGDGDDEFGGESLVRQTSVGGDADILLIHEPSNTVLSKSTVTLGLPGTSVDFSTETDFYPPGFNERFTGATTVVRDGGRSVSMTGNNWSVVPFSKTITDDTVLTFEFRSTDRGEIHGIGLQADDRRPNNRESVEVYGVQNWGVNVTNYGQRSYSGNGRAGEWVRFEIPVGQIAGVPDRIEYLVFINDDDDGNFPGDASDDSESVNSQFRDVRVYNASD